MMRRDGRTFAAREKFFHLACDVIESRTHAVTLDESGQKRSKSDPMGFGPRKDYLVYTRCGILRVHVTDDTIYSRFDEPKRAAELFDDVNPFSGKWNWHWFGKPHHSGPEMVVNGFATQYDEIVIDGGDAADIIQQTINNDRDAQQRRINSHD